MKTSRRSPCKKMTISKMKVPSRRIIPCCRLATRKPRVDKSSRYRAIRIRLLTVQKVSFLKKFVHYAKTRIKPQLSEEASDYIVETYADLREKAAQLAENKRSRGFPVTPRTLEALIRLATAHAKARLSARVEKVSYDIW